MVSSPFQPATFNPFHAAGAPGPSTNPFPQIQTQTQPTSFLQPQFTAVPGVAQQPTNPFPGLQTTSPVPLQTQMTGVNPFRSSTLPMQPTGLSPFAPTNPMLSAPTGANPFSSQNGFLGTDPYATTAMNSGTPLFPINAHSTNPFPVVGNVNPFTAQTNNLASNAAGPNPFSSASSNPFPTRSQTLSQPFSLAYPNQPTSTDIPNTSMSHFTSPFTPPAPVSVPTRPASTPLAQTKPSSPPPMPVKSHQTGSRNPFGVPKAPSPPPLPRAPTLFELANNIGQPHQPQQSQSPVQVKPQATGLPTTTFTSVASSFITGGSGGTQAPQVMTSPLITSLGSPSMDTSTPTSLTATTSTGSTSSNLLFSSLGGQPTGSTFLSSQPTGAPLRPQTTGFTGGVKAFKPTSSFGASLLEALPPIPQSEPSTPALDSASTATTLPPVGTTGTTSFGAPAGAGFGVGLSGVSSPTIGLGTGTSGGAGLGGLGLATQPTGFSPTGAGMGTGTGGPTTAFGGGSSLGVGLRPQATGLGLGAANPFRASMLTPGVGGGVGAGAGAGAGGFPAFSTTNASAGTGLFLQPTGAPPSFGQSLFMGAQTEASKQNGAAQLI